MCKILGVFAAFLLTASLAIAQEFAAAAVSPAPSVDELQRQVDDLQARFAALERERTAIPVSNETTLLEQPATDEQPARCGSTWTDCCRAAQGTWVGGATLYVLRPHWSSGNPAYVTTDLSALPNIVATTTPFNNNPQAAPGGWIGYVHSSGYGIRANYFQFNQTASVSTTPTTGLPIIFDPSFTINTGIGGTFTATSNLAINIWDLEATKTVKAWNWTWTGAAGLRYVYLNQSYAATSTIFGFPAVNVNSRQFFNGAGPTLAFEGRRPVGRFGLGVFGGARGALAFGWSNQSWSTSSPFSGGQFNSGDRSLLPMAQMELGVDFRRKMGRTTLLVENALIGQAYFDVGNSSGYSVTNAPGLPGASPFQSNATLGLFGLRSSFGLTF